MPSVCHKYKVLLHIWLVSILRGSFSSYAIRVIILHESGQTRYSICTAQLEWNGLLGICCIITVYYAVLRIYPFVGSVRRPRHDSGMFIRRAPEASSWKTASLAVITQTTIIHY
jgi:hypothetical protein